MTLKRDVGLKCTNSLPWSSQESSRKAPRGQKRTRTRPDKTCLVFMPRNLASKVRGLSGRQIPEMYFRFCSTTLCTSSAMRKIFINTESTRSQGGDHQEASRNTHIFKEVLGFMVAFHTLGKIPKIMHIDADDERQAC